MKKLLVLLLILALSFSLFACGGGGDESNNKEETLETPAKSSVYFKDDTLKINMATLKLTGAEVAPADEWGENGYLVIFYEVTNDQTDETLSPSDVFRACFDAQQESDTTVDTLDMGILPDVYEDKEFPYDSSLKPGATGSDVACFELNGTSNPVTLLASQGLGGEKLGEKVYNLS